MNNGLEATLVAGPCAGSLTLRSRMRHAQSRVGDLLPAKLNVRPPPIADVQSVRFRAMFPIVDAGFARHHRCPALALQLLSRPLCLASRARSGGETLSFVVILPAPPGRYSPIPHTVCRRPNHRARTRLSRGLPAPAGSRPSTHSRASLLGCARSQPPQTRHGRG